MEVDFAAAMKPKAQRQKPPPPAKVYDLEPVKEKFLAYRQEIDTMVAEAGAIEVKDEGTNIRAVEMGTGAKGLAKKIEAEAKRIIDDPEIQRILQFVKSLKDFVKPFKERLADIETLTKGKIRDYQYRVELARQEAEIKTEKARKELQDQLDKEAEEKSKELGVKVDSVKVETQIVPKTTKPTRTATGSSFQRKDWTFEVEDLGELIEAAGKDEALRKFLLADKTSLNQAVGMGMREIPGIKIFEKSTTVYRT